MIGYSGTGYKGMQLYVQSGGKPINCECHLTHCRNHQEKTIEGDLFAAFVAAGAISKANADDPKKSSLVRCARTDKGVHAAGNVISLKLVTEDADIVSKINEHLSPQIRVWGIERTNNSFSAYQLCDSRIYEYLIPSYCLLPPHPRSFLGRQIAELAEEEGDRSAYESRQEEVADFWKIAEDEHVNPVIEGIDDSIRDEVLNRFHIHESPKGDKIEQTESIADYVPSSEAIPVIISASPNEQVDKYEAPQIRPISKGTSEMEALGDQTPVVEMEEDVDQSPTMETKTRVMSPIDLALRALKSAHATAKRAHRIPPARLARINSVLSRFVGSYRYHNYTIDKSARDPSSIRIIKNFHVSDTPIMIGGTEWLSLKVHGQSFMMHQIRKMVSAAVLIVRCGCHEGRIQDTFLPDRLSIPKAPSLGLLLERPVFDAYNAKLVEFGREKIDFGKYDKEISEFKQREIYERIFRDEEKEGTFLAFFAGLDSTRSAGLLWASSKGLAGTKKEFPKAVAGDPEGVAAAFF